MSTYEDRRYWSPTPPIVLRRGLDASPRRTRYRCPTFSLGNPSSGIRLDKALAMAGLLEDEETARKLALRK